MVSVPFQEMRYLQLYFLFLPPSDLCWLSPQLRSTADDVGTARIRRLWLWWPPTIWLTLQLIFLLSGLCWHNFTFYLLIPPLQSLGRTCEQLYQSPTLLADLPSSVYYNNLENIWGFTKDNYRHKNPVIEGLACQVGYVGARRCKFV